MKNLENCEEVDRDVLYAHAAIFCGKDQKKTVQSPIYCIKRILALSN